MKNYNKNLLAVGILLVPFLLAIAASENVRFPGVAAPKPLPDTPDTTDTLKKGPDKIRKAVMTLSEVLGVVKTESSGV